MLDPTTPRRVVLLLKGHPATGKSTLTAALTAALVPTATVCHTIDKDDHRPAGADAGDAAAANEAAYRGAAARVAELCGVSSPSSSTVVVVVDSPLSSRPRWYALAQAAGDDTTLVLIETSCSDADLWRARLEARAAADAGTHAAHKPASWDALQALITGYAGSDGWPDGADTATAPPWHARLSVDAAREPTADAAARIVAELRARGWVA